jgi:hypothetical protein
MFVGFDSKNTSHFFEHYPDWNLRVVLLEKMLNHFLCQDVKTDGKAS